MPRKLNLNEINARLMEHGFKLIGEYVNANTHTLFRCKHGHEWLAQPRYIINQGYGCPHCAGNFKLSKKDIDTRLKGRGINLISDITGTRNKATFSCDLGHQWQAEINTVLNNRSGCPHCSGNFPLNTKIVNERLEPRGIQMIGEYRGTRKYSLFKCQNNHEWKSLLNSVLSGNGCPTCAIEKERYTTEEFIKLAHDIHGHKFDYSKTNYLTKRIKVEIICKKHGSFWQLAGGHLAGRGCQKCAVEEITLSVNQFIKKAKIIHGNKYDYSKVVYKTNQQKTEFICPHHGSFWQLPMNHLQGNGCPGCATSGFDQTKPAILYYLAVLSDNNETLYKIGITNLSVRKRFSRADLKRIRTIKTWSFSLGAEAADRELLILRKYSAYIYKGPEILIGAGNTELFTQDVLELDLAREKASNNN